MKAPLLKMTVGILPYSDGSGDQVTATVERTDEGAMLTIAMVHRVPLDNWSDIRDTINDLVKGANAMLAHDPR